jgi:hypothetical protein
MQLPATSARAEEINQKLYGSTVTVKPLFVEHAEADHSRIGFVHEFRPLDAMEMQALLDRHWTPAGVSLPNSSFTPEVVARLIRITSGNFRLLARLLTQVGTCSRRQRPPCRHPRGRRSTTRQPRHWAGMMPPNDR